jgi:N-acetylneuraminic acid mutarotase
MREARSNLGVAVVNGKIFAIGGAGKGGFHSFNEEYDPATNSWKFKAPMPTPRSSFAIAVCQNKIYCTGGYTAGFSATDVNEVYDPATDTWETKAPLQTSTLNVQANVVNGKIYLIGGNSNGTQNQVYDPETDSWTTMAAVPNIVGGYVSAVVDNKIYVISSELNQIYDPENDSWSLGAPAPSPVILASAGATTGVFAPARIYVFGADADLAFWQLTTRKFTAQSYDPKTDSWMVCASMLTGRYSASVAVVDDLLYVIGGFTTGFRTDRFTPNPIYTYSAVNQQYAPIGYGTIPPKISVTAPENKTYATGNVSLTFTVNKPVVWLGYCVDGQKNITISGNTTIGGLTSGLHNVTVYTEDTFQSTGTSITIIFRVAEPEVSPATFEAIASGASVAVVGVCLLAFFRKRGHRTKTAAN